MERALTLIANGVVTTAVAHHGTSKGNTFTLTRTLNNVMGKGSTRQTGFNDAMWGKATRSYTASAHSLTNAKFDDIVQKAQQFVVPKPNRARNKTTEIIDIDDDERACLVASDDDCKLFSPFMALLT